MEARAIAEALRRLDKRHLVLAIHDASFPCAAGEDCGRGTPYGRGGHRFVAWAREVGFDGLQLGPQGHTTWTNQSPYDGTLFSRNLMSLDFHALLGEAGFRDLVDRSLLEARVRDNPEPAGGRVAYRHAFGGVDRMLDAMYGRFRERRQTVEEVRNLAGELDAFRRQHARWLEPDALFEVLSAEHAPLRWRDWPEVDRALWDPPPDGREAAAARLAELRQRHDDATERWALAQLGLARQHQRLREHAGRLGVRLFGDVQVGLSSRDAWARQAVVLSDYRLGAPPSRTNPEGQPWNHSVLDPELYCGSDGRDGPVMEFIRERLGKMLDEFDGLRIDHPHGLVCPWVYRSDDPNPTHAVQHGARLFASPDLEDHPGLARYAITRPEQLDRTVPRHADGWVRDLEPVQVERYASLIDVIVETARQRNRDVQDILCEVLSTQPRPLARVMERHGMGRFRVTQKADLDDPADVYRSENAHPEDWVMVGNHDTKPIWSLAREWHGTPAGEAQARFLARRLAPRDPGPLEQELRQSPGALVHAKLADVFASASRNVMVFFPDLLGIDQVYNRPGTVDDVNWTLRVPSDWERRYAEARGRGEAVDLGRVLGLALRSRQ